MKTELLTTVILPMALGVTMLGLGLGLTISDFKRVLLYPKAVVVGLLCQMILLPVVCFGIAIFFNLPPELAVGLMLLSASPGGPTANLFSHFAKGDVALNITLTAVNSILCLISLPLITGYSLNYFMGSEQAVPMPTDKVIQVFSIILVPVAIGMLTRVRAPQLGEKLSKPIKILSAVLLLAIIVGAVLKEKENLSTYFAQVGEAVFLFNILSLAVGYQLPRLLKLDKKQSIAIGMEIGIHNGALAMSMAINVLGSSAMAIPPAIYGLMMYFTAGAFGYLVTRKKS